MVRQDLMEARKAWAENPDPTYFGKAEFGDVRHALYQHPEELFQVSDDERAWLLQGSLYDGHFPAPSAPTQDAAWALAPCEYWLVKSSFRGPKYRSAALMQHLTHPGAAAVLKSAADRSRWRNMPKLIEAVRRGTVIEFVQDPLLADDLSDADPYDIRQRRAIVQFAEWLEVVYESSHELDNADVREEGDRG